MDELIKEITAPLKDYFHQHGYLFLEKNTYLFLLLLVFIIVPALSKFFGWLFKEIKAEILSRVLDYYDGYEIANATKYYIETNFQNIDPANQHDFLINQSFVAKEKLIPFFIKRGLKSNSENKYFFVLADSGMGKTTFMINLYFRYFRLIRWPKYHIKLLPLGKRDIEHDIIRIEEPKKTILLLDAFDEDQKAIVDYKKRLSDLLEITSDFKSIIISSRTQFFSSALQEPAETGIMKYGVEKGIHKFFKIYISPFTEKDIKRYLRKKYFSIQFKKKRAAKKIILRCPNLMIRPMLLAYIDDLVTHEKGFSYTFQIYDVLIQKWIEREASRVEFSKRVQYNEQLYNFSKAIAVDIYEKRKIRTELFINGEDIKPFAEKNNINLSDLDLKTKSLLNRNSEGQYKFSHKSILEYFLSLELYANAEFKENFDFESMPQSLKFYSEMCEDNIVANAIFLNKTIPYSNTLFNGLITHYGNTFDKLYVKDSNEISILNPGEIDEKFFVGLVNVQVANVLITKSLDVDKILLIPNIKKINLLNTYPLKKTLLDAMSRMQDFDFVKEYILDFKNLIINIHPDINKKITGNDVSLGNKVFASLDKIKGTNEVMLRDLRDLYENTIIEMKKDIHQKKNSVQITNQIFPTH